MIVSKLGLKVSIDINSHFRSRKFLRCIFKTTFIRKFIATGTIQKLPMNSTGNFMTVH